MGRQKNTPKKPKTDLHLHTLTNTDSNPSSPSTTSHAPSEESEENQPTLLTQRTGNIPPPQDHTRMEELTKIFATAEADKEKTRSDTSKEEAITELHHDLNTLISNFHTHQIEIINKFPDISNDTNQHLEIVADLKKEVAKEIANLIQKTDTIINSISSDHQTMENKTTASNNRIGELEKTVQMLQTQNHTHNIAQKYNEGHIKQTLEMVADIRALKASVQDIQGTCEHLQNTKIGLDKLKELTPKGMSPFPVSTKITQATKTKSPTITNDEPAKFELAYLKSPSNEDTTKHKQEDVKSTTPPSQPKYTGWKRNIHEETEFEKERKLA